MKKTTFLNKSLSKKTIIKILKIALPLLLGVFLIIYMFKSATVEEREKLWSNIVQAEKLWIFVSLFLGILSHASRAYRWKYLLEPLGYQPKFYNSFMAVMVAYLANLGIPRSGEVLRGATISTYEGVPFEKAFGTIVSERIADLVMLLIVIGVAIFLQTETVLTYFKNQNINPLFAVGIVIGLFLGVILFIRLLRHSSNKYAIKVRTFAEGLLDGMKSILTMKRKKEFVVHTIFIWVMYLLMFGVIKHCIPGTENLSIAGILVAFVVGSFAISATNGGIGIYPFAIGAILIYFGIEKQDGEAFGWIIWGAQTILNIILGGLSFILLPILNRNKG